VKPEDLVYNHGKPVTVYLDDNWNEARATLRAWSRDCQTVFVRLDSQYGRKWKSGMVIELPIGCVSPAKEKS
jgi:hypothetical protein